MVLAQRSHQEIDEALDRVEANLTPEERRLADGMAALQRGEFANNPELRAVIEQGKSAGLFANWQIKTPRQQQHAIANFLLDVANNNFENKAAMALASLFNISVKTGFCVMLMTFSRQLAANGMSDDAGFTDDMRKVAGGLVAALPVALLTAGGIKDYRDRTATTWSSISRGTLALVGATALAVTAALGNLDAAAPSLVAFGLAYCLGRDTSQLFIRTPNQIRGIQFKPSLVSGVAYGGVEMGVGSAMSYGAPGSSVRSDGLRGSINGGGEATDEINLTLAHLFKEGMDDTQGNVLTKFGGGLTRVRDNFRSRLSPQVPTGREVANMLLGSYPARAALFGVVVMAAVNFGVKTPNLDPEEENNYGNMVTALILGALYTAFAGMFAKKDPNARAERDEEEQVEEVNVDQLGRQAFIEMTTPRLTPVVNDVPVINEEPVAPTTEHMIPIGTSIDDATQSGAILATSLSTTPPTGSILHRATSRLSQEEGNIGSTSQLTST
ncbi:hypothetical protein [Trinickia acidisoli]|uniref:hypothetical protein n=1 Tax=Trinickia acidisoli TaxID=2767482 RepID=UPI001A8F581B|nr:hypothetical protein [Trinickia acidisoli]